MENYYIYYVTGMNVFNYLGGTNYVGIWANSKLQAEKKVREYFSYQSFIRYVGETAPKDVKVGYLH